MNNIHFPISLDLKATELLTEHREYLTSRYKEIEENIEKECVSISMCVEGLLIEYLIHGKPLFDWIGIKDELLRDENLLAYSKNYGNLLNNFSQYYQSPIYALYYHRLLEEEILGKSSINYHDLILNYVQPTGWIYNPDVSPTNIRTRMKTELFMSMAMGSEILLSNDGITKELLSKFQSAIASINMTGFLGAEYYRLKSLKILDSTHFVPNGYGDMVTSSATEIGFCDFSLSNKVDDYMGTQKRTSRDQEVHSAIAAVHASELSNYVDKRTQEFVNSQVNKFTEHLMKNPLDLPAFRMRDIEIPFGIGVSTNEIIHSILLFEKFVNE